MTDDGYTLTCPACDTDYENTEAPTFRDAYTGRAHRVCRNCTHSRGPVVLVYLQHRN